MTVVLFTTQSLHGMASIGCEMGALSGNMYPGRRPRLRSHLIFLMNDESENSYPGNWIRLAISCSPLTLCEIAEVFALMPSTNTTANIMKGYERGPVQRNELWGHPQKMLQPNVEAQKKYIYICIYMNWYDICIFVKKCRLQHGFTRIYNIGACMHPI